MNFCMIYKFNQHTSVTRPEHLSAYATYKHLENGGKITELEQKQQNLFSELWHYDSYKNGIVKQMGWAFDFRQFFKLYLVKTHEGWREQYAPNKTFIRKNAITPSHILKIIEL